MPKSDKPAPAETEVQDKPAGGGIYVCEGCSVLCKTGVVDEGDKVEEKQFSGGQETVEKLIKSGHLERR